jgi:cytosine/adenosine deaminase-related metal-dependent hydrolase
MTYADLVISNAQVVTVDPQRRVIGRGGIAVVDDRIVAVGDDDMIAAYDAPIVIDAEGQALLPGFVNAHTHATHGLLRGGPSDDRVLYDWLVNSLNPGMKAYTERDVELAALLYSVESLRSGITTSVDNADYGRAPFAPATTLGVYSRMGVRVVYGRLFFDTLPSEFGAYISAMEGKEPEIAHDHDFIESASAVLAETDQLIRKYHGSADGRIHVWPGPAVAITTTAEGLLGAKDLARKHGTGVMIHVAQSHFDRLQHGVSSIEYLAAIGFLGPETLCAHMVQVDATDIRILKNLDVKVAHCPVSNMFVADGIAPVMEMHLAGITTGLGTDDVNANQNANMFQLMKFAALGQKVRYESSAAITAEKVLEMATIDGARAIGLAAEIGSLEVGKKADAIIVDFRHPQCIPSHNAASTIVYQAYGTEVDTVVIDGQVLMRRRALTRLPEEEETALLIDAQAASQAILDRAGMHKLRDRAWTSMKGV